MSTNDPSFPDSVDSGHGTRRPGDPGPGGTRRKLLEMAGLLTAVHLLSLGGLRVAAGQGASPAAAADRHAWLADFPPGWTLVFGGWILASFSLLGFFLFLHWDRRGSGGTRAACWLAVVAVLSGLTSRVFLAGGLPLVATLEPLETFLVAERVVWAIELVPTRAAQAAAIAVASLGLARDGAVNRPVLLLAVGAILSSLVVVGAGLLDRVDLALLALAPEVGMLSAWSLASALQLRRAPAA